ncbi:BON domain-containing protein [Cellvibrio sp.]|uniref:BON domain-containing protein n=1 Tax=Cellvibrio sp. TaxID=1965322 RepID=UPI00396479D1
MKVSHRIAVLSLTLCGSLLLNGCAEVINATTSKPIEMKANERTMGAKLNDNEIETAAKVNIKKADPQLENAHINIDSFNGIVLLTGQVPSDDLRNLVANTVYKLNPVREIHNELVVGGPTDFAARAKDTWISTKIKAQLLADSETESRRVHFVTENQAVFLMGIVTRAEADRIVNMVSHTADVQKVVKVFEYVD